MQGYVLEPFLYTVYDSQLFDLTPLFAFTDGNHVIEAIGDLAQLFIIIETKMETMTKWI